MSSWQRRLSRGAYSGLLRLAQPAYVLRLWLRGREEPLYRDAIGERFGRYGAQASTQGWMWIHAVSLGETRAAAPLIAALRAQRPSLRLLLTHGTATGREAGRALLRDGDAQAWLPYDSPGAVRRFLGHFRPALGVMMETEVWPNLLCAARQAQVPMALANARLSEKSRRQGERLDAILRPAVQSFALVLAQTEADAQRLRERGAAPVEVAGNLKFDVSPDAALLARGREWRQLLGRLGRPVLLAAVTREGEEAQLLEAWQAHAWPQGRRRPLLLLVPRHPQRFAEVAELLVAQGLTLARRSGFADAPDAEALAADAWLGDSMGEMVLYYGLADVALLGGSFAPLGGQNLIEAAACACPVVMGPHTFNFASAAELSQQAGAAFRVDDMAAGLAQALRLLAEPASRAAAGQAGLAFAAQHRGAAERMAQRLLALLP
ncbi:MAG: 3-deoxy-D-manno-octulosonic acid transferase [Burkholderiaceae bacterium]|nr:3-deoxy-D-manno-octulosonic acid transferase [Burkholderiaceae bacterium]